MSFVWKTYCCFVSNRKQKIVWRIISWEAGDHTYQCDNKSSTIKNIKIYQKPLKITKRLIRTKLLLRIMKNTVPRLKFILRTISHGSKTKLCITRPRIKSLLTIHKSYSHFYILSQKHFLAQVQNKKTAFIPTL